MLLVLVLLALATTPVHATHLRAGDIQAKIDTTVGPTRNPNRVFFKMVLYQRTPSSGVPDEATATIFFGDCNSPVIVPRTSVVAVNNETNRNTYLFEHIYSAPGTYTISYIGENRNTGVLNMALSANQSFYISTTITIDPGLGQNSSPILTKPAIDNAAVSQVFVHNPAAYDADGDSLAYVLRSSQQVPGGVAGVSPPCYVPAPQTVPAYQLPNLVGNGIQVSYPGPPVGQPGNQAIFEMDPVTGTIVWNAPITAGEYNIAFIVQEWRRTQFGRRLIGQVIRDMQIIVRATNNTRPTLTIPADLCVVAGTPVTGAVTATDDNRDAITLEANSGILPPATFVQTSSGPPTAAGTFRWTPSCENISNQPITVSFTARDRPANISTPVLIDQRVWRITVVGPPPQSFQAALAGGNTANLSWASYSCQRAGARILIFRKEGNYNFNPTGCNTGIPAGSGYTQIADVPVTATSYSDNRGGLGLERGKTYCYRIYVQFALPAGGKSLASQEACVDLVGKPLALTNVTVDRTATTNGQITVKWTKPALPGGSAFNPPLIYRLSRATGQGGTAFAVVRTVTGNLNDTTYVDNDPTLDTQNQSYTYKIEFVSNATPQPGSTTVTETAAAASSVRVTGTANSVDRFITLNWTYTVPWDNAQRPTTIFRRTGSTGAFTQIATVTGTTTGGTYVDRGTTAVPLVRDETYCYYVSTNGTYSNPQIVDPLINLSQQQCIGLRAIPCTPVLSLKRTNCDSLASRLFELPSTPISGAVYTNSLSWTLGSTPSECNRNVTSYNIYYSPTIQDSLRLLATVPATQTSYEHRNLSAEAGCYGVRAVDANGTLSARSNVECKDDCQLFLLPNIFTPNGDGRNDVFRPKVFTPIRRTVFRAFNRWGRKIYESDKEPLILWNGGGSQAEGSSSSGAVDGVYYYQADVEFADPAGTKRTYKGWVEIVR